MVEDASNCFCSDSVCLPARIASAHLVRLGGLGVDRVLFPMVVFEAGEAGASTHFNCPIVTGYPEVVASNVPAGVRQRMPVATPPVSFKDRESLRVTARKALAAAGVAAEGFDTAFDAAWDDYQAFLQRRRRMGREAIEQARARQRPIVLLACRPYHLDPYLNHGIPEMLAGLGYDVVSSQWLAGDGAGDDGAHILGQWAYPNRVLQAADWAGGQPDVQLVQLNSFGCGPDAIVADEAAERLAAAGQDALAAAHRRVVGPGVDPAAASHAGRRGASLDRTRTRRGAPRRRRSSRGIATARSSRPRSRRCCRSRSCPNSRGSATRSRSLRTPTASLSSSA